MSESGSDSTLDSAAVLQSMTLLATLSTAEAVREAVAERRAGRDPSAQAPTDVAMARLHDAGDALMDLLMQLVLGRAPDRGTEDDRAHAVRHFDLLMKLRRAERLTQTMHQHLLSLYPDVSEALVEEARRVQDLLQAVQTLKDTDGAPPPLPDVLEQGVAFVAWVRREV